ncbi:hypothetical protein [Sphingobium amiense]|nr:hypothetical protein [Sphingobium amiense]
MIFVHHSKSTSMLRSGYDHVDSRGVAMPYNVDFRLPVHRAIHRPASAAPKGSLILPVLGASGFVCWRPVEAGKAPPIMVVEWTTYSAHPLEGNVADEPCLVFEEPEIRLDPATAFDPRDKGARDVGDIVTNGDTVMISAWTAEQELKSFLLRAGKSTDPMVAYKGWDVVVEGQHIFTKLP